MQLQEYIQKELIYHNIPTIDRDKKQCWPVKYMPIVSRVVRKEYNVTTMSRLMWLLENRGPLPKKLVKMCSSDNCVNPLHFTSQGHNKFTHSAQWKEKIKTPHVDYTNNITKKEEEPLNMSKMDYFSGLEEFFRKTLPGDEHLEVLRYARQVQALLFARKKHNKVLEMSEADLNILDSLHFIVWHAEEGPMIAGIPIEIKE